MKLTHIERSKVAPLKAAGPLRAQAHTARQPEQNNPRVTKAAQMVISQAEDSLLHSAFHALRLALYSPECSSQALVGNLGTAWQLICKKIICPPSDQEMFFILTISAKHVKDLGSIFKCQIT